MRYFIFPALLALMCLSACRQQPAYESVPDDPFQARIYTLDNGLKIYMTVYKDAPRIQANIAVRAGGKNDPAATTGLSHYFEHLMFKGTKSFGTTDWEKEKPLLDEIERLFEVYRTTADEDERKALYRQIDSVSQAAAAYAVPNEYDKLMSAIGSQGTNAYTSYDVTAFVENIPSNQLENWAYVQSERFHDAQIRLFHTELEAVYEEKNMSLTSDGRKMSEALLAGLFPHHPYGTQTVLGTQEHLKNPSIVNLKKHFATYYVPDNMAVFLAGDFDPDEAFRSGEKYFGDLKPGHPAPLQFQPEQALTAPVEKEVTGLESEALAIGYRFEGAASRQLDTLRLLSMLLSNGTAGLIDLDLNQRQKVLSADAGLWELADYSMMVLEGMPQDGQSLDEVRDLLLGEMEKIKRGEFADWLLTAVVNEMKLADSNLLESNNARASSMIDAFINGIAWSDFVQSTGRMAALAREDVVKFANRHFGDNYVVVYKRQGKDPNERKIDKPAITPIPVDREKESAFMKAFRERTVTPIEPVFVDFDKDIETVQIKDGLPLWYKQNTENQRFSLTYLYELGTDSDPVLSLAGTYLDYLGTADYTPEALKEAFYKIGCSYSLGVYADHVEARLGGLQENMDEAVALFEQWLNGAVVAPGVYDMLVTDILQSRINNKASQSANFSALSEYGMWGAMSPMTRSARLLSTAVLQQTDPQTLVDKVKGLSAYKHTIWYYGSAQAPDVQATMLALHRTADVLREVPEPFAYTEQPTDRDRVLFAHYDARQTYMRMLSKAEPFRAEQRPVIVLYNEYFGGNMSSIVFQEMREARALAYRASASYAAPSRLDRSYYMNAMIATQNDKLEAALQAFDSIINVMPESVSAFELAKQSVISQIRNNRITKEAVFSQIRSARRLGLDSDIRRLIFEKVPGYTMEDIRQFQQQYVKGRHYTYCVLGDRNDLDFDMLRKLGEVTELSQEEMFGY